MSNRVLGLILVGALLGVGGWWFTQRFHFTKERVWVGYQGEARYNPYFAAHLLLERMGLRVQQKMDLAARQALPPRGTVVLTAYRSEMSPTAVAGLLEWVERGGNLLIAVENHTVRDPLLDAIGVNARWPSDGANGHACAAPENADTVVAPDTVVLPDGERLRADLRYGPVLDKGEKAQAWEHASAAGTRIMELEWGDGRIALFGSFRPFSNAEINELDHAALLWSFAGRASGELYFVRYLESENLLSWLRAHAAFALAAAAAFVLLWLWRVVPRFGPLQPSPAPDRRSLLEHIRALGRFHVEQQQLGRLIGLLRKDCLELFDRAAPLSHGLDSAARLKEASRLTDLRPRELMQAFTGPLATLHDFHTAVRTLASFRRRILRRPSAEENP
jgi:hypothetical protein